MCTVFAQIVGTAVTQEVKHQDVQSTLDACKLQFFTGLRYNVRNWDLKGATVVRVIQLN